MLTPQTLIQLTQALNAIKLSNRDIGSYINKTPQNTGKLEHLEAVRLQVKLDILLGELIEKITYKEWGVSKIARSVPLEEGTYFKTDVQTNTKEEVSFESLELSTEELELIRKTGVVWIFTKNQQLT